MADTPQETIDALNKQIDNLTERLKKADYDRSTAVATLRKETRLTCHIIEEDIIDWPFLTICDKKVLAVLHWSKLSEAQQKEFDDIAFKEIEEASQRFREDTMTDPIKMKRFFLKHSYPILNQLLDSATNPSTKIKTDGYAFKEVWEVLRGIINSTNDQAPAISLKGKEISDQIDEILTKVTAQEITFDQAKEYMSLISSGFNLQELPKLMAKLDALESM